MVRRIIGALVDVGRGHRDEDDIKNSLIGCESRGLVCAPAKGLMLVKVKY
jgi:tRNA U38,U39,U40 pseudouridine synthase TruA